ncbi:MAG: type VI secretion system contractile sheath small subunit [Nitrospirae bacterium]|jgi:type VI secretion system protein ImpB|nr:type VI secretion system contractile sheath small subunit [Nitrospirota bacterium]
MDEQGSVAPKERVNIVYRPSTGDAKEEVELSFKQLVIGDFTQKEDDRQLEEIKPINVDKDNFDNVLQSHNLSLDLNVPNHLENIKPGEEPTNMTVSLSFKSLKDFDPDSIVEQVPELRELIALRDALKALKGPLGNIPDFRKKLQEIIRNEGTREKFLSELGIKDS